MYIITYSFPAYNVEIHVPLAEQVSFWSRHKFPDNTSKKVWGWGSDDLSISPAVFAGVSSPWSLYALIRALISSCAVTSIKQQQRALVSFDVQRTWTGVTFSWVRWQWGKLGNFFMNSSYDSLNVIFINCDTFSSVPCRARFLRFFCTCSPLKTNISQLKWGTTRETSSLKNQSSIVPIHWGLIFRTVCFTVLYKVTVAHHSHLPVELLLAPSFPLFPPGFYRG